MFKRVFSVILSVLLIFFIFTSCSSSGSRDAKIVVPIDNDPGYLDPQITYETGAMNIIANCFEGLVTLDENGTISPGVAESWDITGGGLVYTFKLRKDCSWRVTTAAGKTIGDDYKTSFNAAVTANDFVFAFKRALEPDTKSPFAENLFSIKNALKVNSGTLSPSKLGVRATDDYTLEITLAYPDSDFLSSLLLPACMPCNEAFFELTKGRYGLATRYLIYNGPFYISNWADDSSFSLRRNDNYYDSDNVMPASVYFSVNSEQATREEKIKNQTYTIAPLTAKQADDLSTDDKYTVKSYATSALSFIFNCEDQNLSNKALRQAIAYSLDTSVLESKFGKITAKGILSGGLTIGDSSYREKAASFSLPKYSLKKAQELLQTALDELEVNDVNITVLCSDEDENTVRNVMQRWQSTLGVAFNVFVENVDDITLKSRIESKDYQLAFANLQLSGGSAFNAIKTFTSDSSLNIVNLSSAKYDSIVKSVKKAKSEDEMIIKIEDAEAYLISNCVILPLYESNVSYGYGKGVTAVATNPSGEIVFFKSALA